MSQQRLRRPRGLPAPPSFWPVTKLADLERCFHPSPPRGRWHFSSDAYASKDLFDWQSIVAVGLQCSLELVRRQGSPSRCQVFLRFLGETMRYSLWRAKKVDFDVSNSARSTAMSPVRSWGFTDSHYVSGFSSSTPSSFMCTASMIIDPSWSSHIRISCGSPTLYAPHCVSTGLWLLLNPNNSYVKSAAGRKNMDCKPWKSVSGIEAVYRSQRLC